jgi:amino acid transporter
MAEDHSHNGDHGFDDHDRRRWFVNAFLESNLGATLITLFSPWKGLGVDTSTISPVGRLPHDTTRILLLRCPERPVSPWASDSWRFGRIPWYLVSNRKVFPERYITDKSRTSISAALFAFLGLELVVIAAGEAKFPRRDLPVTVRLIWRFAIVVYVSLMVLAAVNVPFDDPALRPFANPGYIDVPAETLQIFPFANNTSVNTGDRSPFIIAAKRAGFQSALPMVLNFALYLAALTAA